MIPEGLFAYCRLRRDARVFRVDQIETCEDENATFAPRDGFSFAEIVERDRELGPGLFGY